MWPPGASGGRDLGGGVPALPCGPGPRSAMRPPTRRAASPRGHFRCCGRPLLKGRARPKPRRPPSSSPAANPPHLPSHRRAPSPTSRGLPAPGFQRPRHPTPGGPIWPPALAPAWPSGGLSRVAASRLAVPRPASLQRHPAGPNRHPARQPGRAPASFRTSRHSPTEPRAAAAAASLCPLPDPRAVPSLLPGPSQGSAHARPTRSHLARTH